MFELFGRKSATEQIKKIEKKREEKHHKEFMKKYEDIDQVFMRPINQDTVEKKENQA